MLLEEKIKLVKEALFEKFPNANHTVVILLWDDETDSVTAQHGIDNYVHKFTYYNNELKYHVESFYGFENYVLEDVDGERFRVKKSSVCLDINTKQLFSNSERIKKDSEENKKILWLSERLEKIINSEDENEYNELLDFEYISFEFEEANFDLVHTCIYLNSIGVEWKEEENYSEEGGLIL